MKINHSPTPKLRAAKRVWRNFHPECCLSGGRITRGSLSFSSTRTLGAGVEVNWWVTVSSNAAVEEFARVAGDYSKRINRIWNFVGGLNVLGFERLATWALRNSVGRTGTARATRRNIRNLLHGSPRPRTPSRSNEKAKSVYVSMLSRERKPGMVAKAHRRALVTAVVPALAALGTMGWTCARDAAARGAARPCAQFAAWARGVRFVYGLVRGSGRPAIRRKAVVPKVYSHECPGAGRT